MSDYELNLSSLLLKQQFGDIAEQVGTYLIKWGARSLIFIRRDVKLPLKDIKRSLCTLLWHNLAFFIDRPSGVIEYQMIKENVISLVRYPRYIYWSKKLYGDITEIIVEEILQSGRLQMSSTIQNVARRLQGVKPADIKNKFEALVATHFLRRCPELVKSWNNEDASASKTPNLSVSEDRIYQLPDVNLNFIETNFDIEAAVCQEPKSKKIKVDRTQPDISIYWRINHERYHQLLRDQNIVNYMSKRVDQTAGTIVQAMLRRSELKSEYDALYSDCIAKEEIVNLMLDDNMKPLSMDSYLGVLANDESKVIRKDGHLYFIDFRKAIALAAEANATMAVEGRLGTKCSRIFRLLISKPYMDENEIQHFCLLHSKEAKDYTYKLMKENFITVKQIPKTQEWDAASSLFYFYVELEQVCRMLITWIHRALYSVCSRRMHEVKSNMRLVEKQKRVDLAIEKLKHENVAEEDIEAIEELITTPEKKILLKITHALKKLDTSASELDEALFVLTSYLKTIIN